MGFARRARQLTRRLVAATLILASSELLFGGAVPAHDLSAPDRDHGAMEAAEEEQRDESLCGLIRRYEQPVVLEACAN